MFPKLSAHSFNLNGINGKLVSNSLIVKSRTSLCYRETSICDISVKAALEHDPRESRNVNGSTYCISSLISFITYPLLTTTSLRLCVWRTAKTDGEGKDDRQTEGGREREAENDKVGKWETISRGREGERRRGSRCVKRKRPCRVCAPFLAGSDQTLDRSRCAHQRLSDVPSELPWASYNAH